MEIVDSGRLGVVNQVQAVNNVPYGGVYYARSTYRDFDVTGGMWLQKARTTSTTSTRCSASLPPSPR